MSNNRYLFLILLPVVGLFTFCNPTKNEITLASTITFATVEQAKQALIQEDDVTKSWSQFDLDARVQKSGATKDELFDLIQNSVLAWTKEEESKVKSIIQSIDEVIAAKHYYLPIPEEILIVKTNMKEEGGALGYTRANYIILSEDVFTKDSMTLKYLITHELFHILTRNDADFKRAMYSIIGFTTTPPIAFPDSLAALRITNPDAPLIDAYIELNTPDSTQNCAMILYSDRPWEGGSFFDYLNIVFVQLEGNEQKSIAMREGQPVFYLFNEVTNFLDQVGTNTQYIIHPEEILADNFTELMMGQSEVPDQWLLDEMKTFLISE